MPTITFRGRLRGGYDVFANGQRVGVVYRALPTLLAPTMPPWTVAVGPTIECVHFEQQALLRARALAGGRPRVVRPTRP